MTSRRRDGNHPSGICMVNETALQEFTIRKGSPSAANIASPGQRGTPALRPNGLSWALYLTPADVSGHPILSHRGRGS